MAFVLLFSALSYFPFKTAIAEEASQEQKVKASFIFNFVRFVTWPEKTFNSENEPVSLCLMGKEDFADAFAPVLDKKIKGRNISLSHISNYAEIASCHLLYVSPELDDEIDSILQVTAQFNILTVSDMEKFTRKGGMFGLYRDKSRVKVEINLIVTQKQGFVLSSNLLEVAEIIQ